MEYVDHGDRHFMTHKSILQGWAMSYLLSASGVSITEKIEKTLSKSVLVFDL